MVDKLLKNAYIYHSPATDITGDNIAKALGCKSGSKLPKSLKDVSIVVAWGAKTNDPVNLGTTPFLNHPDKIRDNRNKLKALDLMQKAGVAVAPFIDAKEAGNIGSAGCPVTLPVIGRRKFHQGGKGFWTCPTVAQVTAALKEETPAQYFQSMIAIAREFRFHVMGGEVIYAVEKKQRTVAEIEEAYIRHELDRQKSLAEKNGDAFDENTAKLFLKRQAKKIAQDGANQLIRSNRLGWKFSHVTKFDKKLEAEAIKAVGALGLDFGAVDCCLDMENKPFIIEVNTGPGLEGSPFDAYVAAFKALIKEKLAPKKEKKVGQAVTEAKAGLADKAAKAVKSAKYSSKAEILARLEHQKALIEATENDEEAAVLDRVFQRTLGL